jgi:hypothetical protein
VLICAAQSSVKNVFIRGSVVRYVHLPGGAVDTTLLEDGEFLRPWGLYAVMLT